jgi:hypothetical protein
MKYILSLIIGGALVVSGFGQTRNVLVGTNNTVVQPTNFWSADASNARSGLGLGSAATNPTTAFQPASSALTNLSTNNGGSLINLQATNLVGIIPASNISTVNFTNISGTLALTSGGTGATNAATARTNLGLGETNSPTFKKIVLNPFASGALGLQFGTNDTGLYVGGSYDQISFRASGTNLFTANSGFGILNFDVAPTFTLPDITRTNLGLGWSALTNTNSGTGLVSVNTNGDVVSPTNFWQGAPIATTVQYQTNITGTSTNSATNSRNLFLFSLSASVSGVTNTVTLPTNPATTFEGDRATITHLAQTTNAVTAIRQLGAATNLITLNQLDETVLLIYRSGAWRLADNISYIEPIYFSGTNASANAAASRTNLGIGATWLTNTNVTNFRTAIGLGSANGVSFATVSAQEIYDSVGNRAIDLENFILSVGTTSALEWATNQVQVNVPILFNGINTAATTRTNLGLGETSEPEFQAILLTEGTNTFTLSASAGVNRTNLGLGGTNAVTFGSLIINSASLGEATNTSIRFGTNNVGFYAGGVSSGRLTAAQDGNTIWIIDDTNTIGFGVYYPITFQGAAATTNAAITRTNLGLGSGVTTNLDIKLNNNDGMRLYFSNGILTNAATPIP